VHLFILNTIGFLAALRWMYRNTRGLLLTTVGILYPIIKTWRLLGRAKTVLHQIKVEDKSVEPGTTSMQITSESLAMVVHWISQGRRWLVYWALFGLLQLVEHWNRPIQEQFHAYHITKLIVLYWLQCPVSRGAERIDAILLRRRKPIAVKTKKKTPITSNATSSTAHSTLRDQSVPYNVSIPGSVHPPAQSRVQTNMYAYNVPEGAYSVDSSQRYITRPIMSDPEWAAMKQQLIDELTSRKDWSARAYASESAFPATSTSTATNMGSTASQFDASTPIDYAAALASDGAFHTPK
jgi:hypothetical protein